MRLPHLILIFLLTVFCSAAVIHVEQGSQVEQIQMGILMAEDGDTVLVHPGIYYENVYLNKEITLTSLAIYDDLFNWENNANIMTTVIDGIETPLGSTYGSCLAIVAPLGTDGEPIPITPVILGFTFRHGKGTRLSEVAPYDPELILQTRVGGGMLIAGAFPKVRFNHFINNGLIDRAAAVSRGGAAYAGTDIDIDEVRPGLPSLNFHVREDTLDFSPNLFQGNIAQVGRSMYVEGNDLVWDVRNSRFDIYNCEDETVSSLWFANAPGAAYDFRFGQGQECSINHDMWIAPFGSDENGTGSPQQPFRSITHALQRAGGSEDHHLGIHIIGGFYSPFSSGEQIPLNIPNYVSLMGDPFDPPVISAEDQGSVIVFNNVWNSHLERLIITGGYVENGAGGGIAMWDSSPLLLNLTITGNTANLGGAIYGEKSDLRLVNSILWGNSEPQVFLYGNRFPSRAAIAYSDVQGGPESIQGNGLELFWLEGNIDAPPQFAEQFCLEEQSPCVDAGIRDTILVFNNEQDSLFIPPLPFSGSAPDMGGCERGVFIMPGDVDQNDVVNVLDIVLLVDFILGASEPDDFQMMAGDLNLDGLLNVIDIVMIVDIILFSP